MKAMKARNKGAEKLKERTTEGLDCDYPSMNLHNCNTL